MDVTNWLAEWKVTPGHLGGWGKPVWNYFMSFLFGLIVFLKVWEKSGNVRPASDWFIKHSHSGIKCLMEKSYIILCTIVLTPVLNMKVGKS